MYQNGLNDPKEDENNNYTMITLYEVPHALNTCCSEVQCKNSEERGVAPAGGGGGGGGGSLDSINTYKIKVTDTGSRCALREDVEEKQYARFEGPSNYS